MLYRDIYDTIGIFSNILNLNDIMQHNEKTVKHRCELCKSDINNITDRNMIMYSYEKKRNIKMCEIFTDVKLFDYILLGNFILKENVFEEVKQIFCNNCVLNEIDVYYFGLFSRNTYITQYQNRVINKNHNYFNHDYVTNTNKILRRIKYKQNKDGLVVRTLSIRNSQCIFNRLKILGHPEMKKLLKEFHIKIEI
jgi:hypothetical protein